MIDDDGICWDAGNASWRTTNTQATRLDPNEGGWIRLEWVEEQLRADAVAGSRRRWWHRFRRDVDAT